MNEKHIIAMNITDDQGKKWGAHFEVLSSQKKEKKDKKKTIPLYVLMYFIILNLH